MTSHRSRVEREKRPRAQESAQSLMRKTRGPSHSLFAAKSVLAEICRAITLPSSYNYRLGGSYDDVPVALSNPFELSNVDFSAPNGNDGGVAFMKDGVYIAGVSRDPLRHSVAAFRHAGTQRDYVARFNIPTRTSPGGPITSWTANSKVMEIVGDLDAYPIRPTSLTLNSGGSEEGELLFGAEDADHAVRYLWVNGHSNAGAQLVFSFWTTPDMTTPVDASGTGNHILFINEGKELLFNPNIITGGITESFFRMGNVASLLSLTRPATATWTYPIYMSLTYNSNSDGLRYDPIPGLSTHLADVTSVRVLGTSLMFSPVSAALTAGGTIYRYQSEERKSLAEVLTLTTTQGTLPATTPFDSVMKANGLRKINGSKGSYTWHLPMGEDSLDFQYPVIFNDGAAPMVGQLKPAEVFDTVARLHPPGGWALMQWEGAVTIGGSASWPNLNFLQTVQVSLNFETTNTWYHVEFSKDTVPPIELAAALKPIPRLVENPLHWSDITSWINNNAGKIVAAGKALGGALVGAVAPEFMPAYTAVTSMF